MSKKEEIINKLRELNTDYWHVPNTIGTACLDGDFTIEQLKLFIELIEINESNKEGGGTL